MTTEARPPLPASVQLVSHPLVAHRVTMLRDARTDAPAFRQILGEVAALIAFEALADLRTEMVAIHTPVASGAFPIVTESVLLVPILRAGLGMVPAIQQLLPHSEVAHVGLRRDEETLESHLYLDGLPEDLSRRRVVICDPMLATGGSLATVCTMVKHRGATEILALCVLAARPGLERLAVEHPDLPIACAAVDERLDQHGFITPGLGDAGDRLFGPPPRS